MPKISVKTSFWHSLEKNGLNCFTTVTAFCISGFDFWCITCFWQFRRDLSSIVHHICDFLVCRIWLAGDNDQSLSIQWFFHFSDRRLKVFTVSAKKVVMGAFGDGNFSSSIAALTSLLSEFMESQVKSSQVPQPTCWWKWVGERDPV